MRRTTFTLVELLIVIAVIAILLGMLMPALNSARVMAKRISCVGNMKQIGVAHASYISDNDRFATWSPENALGVKIRRGQWMQILGEYTNNNLLPWICPAIPVPLDSLTTLRNPYSSSWIQRQTIGINGWFFYWADATLWLKSNRVTQVKNPSMLIYAGDNVDYNGVCNPGNGNDGRFCGGGGLWPTNGAFFNPCHSNACNILYLDGHCESITRNVLSTRVSIWDDSNINAYLLQ